MIAVHFMNWEAQFKYGRWYYSAMKIGEVFDPFNNPEHATLVWEKIGLMDMGLDMKTWGKTYREAVLMVDEDGREFSSKGKTWLEAICKVVLKYLNWIYSFGKSRCVVIEKFDDAL
jgi:hypothetical protein